MITSKEISYFKKAVKQLLKQEIGYKLSGEYGLCNEISELCIDMQKNVNVNDIDYSLAYPIMRSMLVSHEYEYGIGEKGVLTKDRYNFLIFLNTLSSKEIADFTK